PSRGIRHVGTAGGAEGTPMQELRLVAVSEDGSYAVLTAPGRSGRFSLPIDDRLRIVARGQFSRLAQYEIAVESPLRPKAFRRGGRARGGCRRGRRRVGRAPRRGGGGGGGRVARGRHHCTSSCAGPRARSRAARADRRCAASTR